MEGTWVWLRGWEDHLENVMATHSSILAWRIPWTEEPGRLQSTGSRRARHDWVASGPVSVYMLIGSKTMDVVWLWCDWESGNSTSSHGQRKQRWNKRLKAKTDVNFQRPSISVLDVELSQHLRCFFPPFLISIPLISSHYLILCWCVHVCLCVCVGFTCPISKQFWLNILMLR